MIGFVIVLTTWRVADETFGKRLIGAPEDLHEAQLACGFSVGSPATFTDMQMQILALIGIRAGRGYDNC